MLLETRRELGLVMRPFDEAFRGGLFEIGFLRSLSRRLEPKALGRAAWTSRLCVRACVPRDDVEVGLQRVV